MHITNRICKFLILFILVPQVAFTLDAIPGLKGFGADTRGPYTDDTTPDICIVDSNATTGGSPSVRSAGTGYNIYEGTLNQCTEGLPDGNTFVLFEVSGYITETGVDGATDPYRYDIPTKSAIYGQTAPNPGILLRNIQLALRLDQTDIIFQHVRVRMDGAPTISEVIHKGILLSTSGSRALSNIVIDHVSSSWGADSNLDIFPNNGSTGQITDVTISNSLLAEAIGYPDLQGDTFVGYNSLIGKSQASIPRIEDILLYKNLYSNSAQRSPRLKASSVLMANCYVYNAGTFATMVDSKYGPFSVSLVSNVIDGGPMSRSFAKNYLPNLGLSPDTAPASIHSLYMIDNYIWDLGEANGLQTSSEDNWERMDLRTGNTTLFGNEEDFMQTGETPSNDAHIWPTGLTVIASSVLKAAIINDVGAYPAFRDSVDEGFINDLNNGTGRSTPKKTKPSDDDWPVLAENSITLDIPDNPHTVQGSGYTNLEEWLHQLASSVENPLPTITLPSCVPDVAEEEGTGSTCTILCDESTGDEGDCRPEGGLSVYLDYGGSTCTLTTDYTLTGGTSPITMTDTVSPFTYNFSVDAATPEDDCFVIPRIVNSQQYTVGSPSTETITVRNKVDGGGPGDVNTISGIGTGGGSSITGIGAGGGSSITF